MADIRKYYSRLPLEYQEVEYIQNGLEQSIDTGWYRDYSKNIEIESQVNILATNYRYCILSDYFSGTQYSLSCEIFNDNKVRYYVYGTNDIRTTNTITSGQFHKIIYNYNVSTNKGTVIFDDISTSMDFTSDVQGKVSDYSAYIFVDRVKRYSVYNQPMQLKSLKIKENGVLVRNYIPCYRKSDNVSGLYDIANNVFYTNQENTGNFSVGANVNWHHSLQKYDGATWQDATVHEF